MNAHRPTTIRNVYNWRVKETERMVAIVNETRKLGATVEEGRDYCVITPPKQDARLSPMMTPSAPVASALFWGQ
eukprot:1144916-Pelagomonas_calceolata.AAC.6